VGILLLDSLDYATIDEKTLLLALFVIQVLEATP
jgi:hypothetical protein